MDGPQERQASLTRDGYAIVPDVLDDPAITVASRLLDGVDRARPEVMTGNALFAIRNVFGLVPGLLGAIWTPRLASLVRDHIPGRPVITRSIYFDKPARSNWSVAPHQDISISVDRRAEVPGFSGWTKKRGTIGVIPPPHVLERSLTIRLHLDATDHANGALHVIPGSHALGIVASPPPSPAGVICPVPRGGAMLMRPLLFHASHRSVSAMPRRVLHLEFSAVELPPPLEWAERCSLPA